ncbi:MAG: ribonuclease R [Candidatus Pacebacteria bacterium]|nr:ribonuclease R [Candidatus Paceibacterota bacterium]MBP9780909.1 ribonuclease R [Candidatus Paceibacterota bacterium]
MNKETPRKKSTEDHNSHKKESAFIPTQNITGTLTVTRKGGGFVRPSDPELYKKLEKIDIESTFLNTGLHGDTVEVFLHPHKKGMPYSGEVVKIISRGKFGFSGVLEEKAGAYFLIPADSRMYTNILIPKESLGGAQVGEKVFGIITKWENRHTVPLGEITHVLGKKGDNNAEMLAIALEKGFDETFPSDVVAEAHALQVPISDEEIRSRRDFRSVTTFTVDPVDAKDFDDALSFKDLKDGTYEIGIHIADVSHYVRLGTRLDEEARKRATSVYLVDRTIPMLPEALSNDLCSLNPNTDKLTMSAVFVMDGNGVIKDEWYGRTIIHSDKRFSYEEAQEILDNGEGLYHSELSILNSIAKKLTTKRFEMGAISLDQDEVRFTLDDKGVPVDVYRKVRGDTNRMIEEFMLIANRKVAEHIGKTKKGEEEKVFVYRIHDKPSKERLDALVFFLKSLGYNLPLKNGEVSPKALNALIHSLEGKPEKETIHTVIIRSMAKAIYSTKNIGHFGLAFSFYTHFTSPIRRYPDVVVHRLLDEYLHGHSIKKSSWKEYEDVSLFSSRREKEASDAERGSIKYKQVEYMSTRIGQVFDGVITGITEWGLYVEEKNTKCEGMIRFKDLPGDFYEFDPKHMTLVGKKSKKKFRLGDGLKIKVSNADLEHQIIDYAPA